MPGVLKGAALGALWFVALGAMLSGCSYIDSKIAGAGSSVSTTINVSSAAVLQIDNAYQAAKANGSVAALQAGTQGIVCSVGNASATVALLTKALGNSKHGTIVAVRDATDVYVVASTLCKQAGGTVAGVSIVPASSLGSGA